MRRNIWKNVVGGQVAHAHSDIVVQALRDITLNLHDGDRLGIIGHNGSGKTTLLRVLSGVYEPMSGSIDVNGHLSTLTDITLGMNDEASGYENIVTRGVFMGMTFKEIRSKLKEIEEFSELGVYLHLPVRTYSAGMMLRLAFAVSTCKVPEILILDEMIGAGDENFIKKAQDRTSKLIKDVKIMVLASHDLGILKKFCNKFIKLEKGVIVKEGSIDALSTPSGKKLA
jgi:ABC-type polysaccharide/polyol phosphate transport system ATPase subunit